MTKLSKLGVTKTSQISLEGDGTGFSTGVLELTDVASPCQSDGGILESNAVASERQNGNAEKTSSGKFLGVKFNHLT